MKTRLRIISALILLLAVGGIAYFAGETAPRQQVPADASHARIVIIPVQGMVCGSCVARVKRAVKSLDGVEQVNVSLETREARVRYDELKVTPEQLVSTINGLGYKAGVPVQRDGQ